MDLSGTIYTDTMTMASRTSALDALTEYKGVIAFSMDSLTLLSIHVRYRRANFGFGGAAYALTARFGFPIPERRRSVAKSSTQSG